MYLLVDEWEDGWMDRWMDERGQGYFHGLVGVSSVVVVKREMRGAGEVWGGKLGDGMDVSS